MSAHHSREDLYRFLWEKRDYQGVVTMSQGEIAEEFGISYQRLSIAMSEFIGMNMIHKYRHRFTLLYEPDIIPWNNGFKDLRKRYLKSRNLA